MRVERERGNRAVLAGDDHQPIAEQIEARAGEKELGGAEIVHPVDVRRCKYIRRRALGDLLGERGGCRVAGPYREAGRGRKGSVCLVEGSLETCRREYREGLLRAG